MGLFSFVKKAVVGVASKVVPGGSLVAGAVGVGSKLVKRVNRKVVKAAVIGGGAAVAAGAGGAALERAMSGGDTGRKRYRRIDPGNTRAMRRSIRRIEQGAKMYSKFFRIHHGGVKGAPGVRVKHLKRRAS